MKINDDSEVYQQSFAKSKRLVYIMNHFSYDRNFQTKREGSLEDVKSLYQTFNKLNVTIKERHNLTKKEILAMAQKQSVKNYKGFDFVMFIIMTHGGVDKNLAARDEMYHLEGDFINKMLVNKSWDGVPKVFIIQACRGDLETDAAPFRSSSVNPQDVLKLFATYEGFVSYRTSKGTYFIQDLCEKLNDLGGKEDLMTIMRRVIADVSK